VNLKSFSLVSTFNLLAELHLCISAIRRLYSEIPVYVATDSESISYIKSWGFKYVICLPWCDEGELYKVDVSAVQGDSYHSAAIISKKFDIMALAIRDSGSTLLIDSDVILVQPIDQAIWSGADAMLSPHYYAMSRESNSRKYGVYNAGYTYANTPEVPTTWKKLFFEDSFFYEQECMNRLPNYFDCFNFSRAHNIGFWRFEYKNAYAKKPAHLYRESKYLIAECDMDLQGNGYSFHVRLGEFDYKSKATQERMEVFKKEVIGYIPSSLIDNKIIVPTQVISVRENEEMKKPKAKDEWGNCNILFETSNPDGKFNLGSQPALTTHRGGWLKVLEAMADLNNVRGVYCETFIESIFDWFRRKNEKGNTIPIKIPWVGFIHNPHNIPEWYGGWDGSDDPLFHQSLDTNLGIYTMSEYHAKGLRKLFPNVQFESILHPYPDEDVPLWQGESNQLISVGWWLRRQTSIYTVNVPQGWEKIKIWPYARYSKPIDNVKSRLSSEAEYLDIELPPIKHLYKLSNNKYDALLTESVVLLDLWDTSANNTVLECIQRGVPMVVRDHPAVREYLGDEYPLYFNDLSEVKELLGRIDEASEYLLNLKNSNKFTLQSFVSNLKDSDIYKKI
jgi:hypothetical protein